MTTAARLMGSDIMIGLGSGDFLAASVAANGELLLVSGTQAALQQVGLRLYTMLGALWYDVEYGSLVLQWIREESTPLTRQALCQEVETRVNDDPHVVPGSASCAVRDWDEYGVTLLLSLELVGAPHPYNLILRLVPSGDEAATADVILEVVASGDPADTSL